MRPTATLKKELKSTRREHLPWQLSCHMAFFALFHFPLNVSLKLGLTCHLTPTGSMPTTICRAFIVYIFHEKKMKLIRSLNWHGLCLEKVHNYRLQYFNLSFCASSPSARQTLYRFGTILAPCGGSWHLINHLSDQRSCSRKVGWIFGMSDVLVGCLPVWAVPHLNFPHGCC